MTNSKIKLIAILMFPIVIQSAAITDWNQKLLEAAQIGNLNQVKEALSNGATIDVRNIYPRTPLHWAAINGHTEIVNTLILAKATIDARDDFQCTPLHYAAMNGRIEAVNTLIKAKATIDAKNIYQRTPLHYAASYGHTEIVNALLDVGSNSTLLIKDNKTIFSLITESWVIKPNEKEQLTKIIKDHQAYQESMLKEVPKLFVEQRDQFNIPEPIANLITRYAFGICEADKNNKGDNLDKL